MKHLTPLLLCFSSWFLMGQTHPKPTYLAFEPVYRNYGTGDISGFGAGVEASKDLKKWLGVGANLSYWSNQRQSWDFVHPFNGFEYDFFDQINELKLSMFGQIFPLNTKYFDFYLHLGVNISHYNQVFYLGGFSTNNSQRTFDVFIQDEGDKGIDMGFEFGFGMRFEFNRIVMVPNVILLSNNLNANGFSGLGLKVGYRFN